MVSASGEQFWVALSRAEEVESKDSSGACDALLFALLDSGPEQLDAKRNRNPKKSPTLLGVNTRISAPKAALPEC